MTLGVIDSDRGVTLAALCRLSRGECKPGLELVFVLSNDARAELGRLAVLRDQEVGVGQGALVPSGE